MPRISRPKLSRGAEGVVYKNVLSTGLYPVFALLKTKCIWLRSCLLLNLSNFCLLQSMELEIKGFHNSPDKTLISHWWLAGTCAILAEAEQECRACCPREGISRKPVLGSLLFLWKVSAFSVAIGRLPKDCARPGYDVSGVVLLRQYVFSSSSCFQPALLKKQRLHSHTVLSSFPQHVFNMQKPLADPTRLWR